jgi:MinD superfamily P-loop ATPase
LHDLKQILGIVQAADISAGVVINRDGIGDGDVEAFLEACSVPVLMRIPYDHEIAAGIAAGIPLVKIRPQYQHHLRELGYKISNLAAAPEPCTK